MLHVLPCLRRKSLQVDVQEGRAGSCSERIRIEVVHRAFKDNDAIANEFRKHGAANLPLEHPRMLDLVFEAGEPSLAVRSEGHYQSPQRAKRIRCPDIFLDRLRSGKRGPRDDCAGH